MQEIAHSINQVITSGGFLYNLSMIIVIGIVAGVKLNEYFVGFKRSMVILIPFIFILLLTNLMRIYDMSSDQVIGYNAYNGSVSIAIVSLAYVVGLFLGHVTFHKAKKDARKEVHAVSR